MKKFIGIFIAVVLLISIIAYYVGNNKKNDITYVVEKEFTTGFFNKYKLQNIDSMELTYSDEILAIINVKGTKEEAPHNTVTYKVLLEKGDDSYWHVKKTYALKN